MSAVKTRSVVLRDGGGKSTRVEQNVVIGWAVEGGVGKCLSLP